MSSNLRSNLRTRIAEVCSGILWLRDHARYAESEQYATPERTDSLNQIQLYALLACCSGWQRSALDDARVYFKTLTAATNLRPMQSLRAWVMQVVGLE